MTNTSDSGDESPTSDELYVRHDLAHASEPCLAIVDAVAAATDSAPTAMPPLGCTVDTDALNALLRSEAPPVTLSFTYHGTDVRVEPGGELTVRVDPV